MADKGNSLADAQGFVREAVRLTEEMYELERRQWLWEQDGVILRGMNVRAPALEGLEWLIVVRIEHDGRRQVGFCSGGSLGACLHLAIARLLNGTMNWKDDKYAD